MTPDSVRFAQPVRLSSGPRHAASPRHARAGWTELKGLQLVVWERDELTQSPFLG